MGTVNLGEGGQLVANNQLGFFQVTNSLGIFRLQIDSDGGLNLWRSTDNGITFTSRNILSPP